jgi:hypothetical protein
MRLLAIAAELLLTEYWHLQHLTKFHFRLVGWHLHHWIHSCSHFMLMSAQFVTLVLRTLRLSGSWLIVTILLLLLSWTHLPTASPVAYLYVPHWCRVSTCVGPFLSQDLLISTGHCQLLSRCPSSWFSSSSNIRRCFTPTCSILPSNCRWQSWSVLFLLREWPFRTPHNRQKSRASLFLSSFWNPSAKINPRLLNLFQAIYILFLIPFPELSRNYISCLS